MRLTLLCLTLIAGTAHAQTAGRAPRAGERIALTAAAAERAAARYPKPTNGYRRQTPRESWVGTADRRCVAVEANEVVRSGDFVAGPFAASPMLWLQGTAKLWWIPMAVPASANPGTGPTLVVHAVRMDLAGTPVVFERETLAQSTSRFSDPASLGRTPDRPLFYPSSFRLPTAGVWMLVAQAGPNWGCFILSLPAA